MDSSVQGELSRAAKSGAVWRDVRRILAIKMHERGCSQEAIAELLEVQQFPASSLHMMAHRWQASSQNQRAQSMLL